MTGHRSIYRTARCMALVVAIGVACAGGTAVASEAKIWPLTDASRMRANQVTLATSSFGGREAIRVRIESDFAGGDSNTLALLTGSDFRDGTIEVDIASRVDPDAWFFIRWFARGFVGIAFRTDEELSRFECLYLRPLNGRADDEERRQHAVQYFSYPDWDFSRFRDESPGKYEAAADIGPDEWIHVRIEVHGSVARLFIDDAAKPVLVVNDLKHGPDQRGGIGLWVDTGTIAHFSNLKITPSPR